MLSRCKHCKEPVSLFAKNCPHCGGRTYHPIFGAIVFVVLLFIFSPLIFPGLKKAPSTQPAPNTFEATDTASENSNEESGNLILGAGTYKVGTDIPAGTYDCIASSGLGVLRGEIVSMDNFVLTMGSSSASIGGYSAKVAAASSYRNLKLTDGDTVYIEMSLCVEFIPV